MWQIIETNVQDGELNESGVEEIKEVGVCYVLYIVL